jgi:membrane protein
VTYTRSGFDDVRDFVRRVYKSAEEDNIFFMAGAIAFNVLVAIVPLILAALGVAGLMVRARSADPGSFILNYINEVLPGALGAVNEAFMENLRAGLNDLIQQSSGLLSLSTLFFIWVATRLVGTLRTALREIFDINQDRGIIKGKIFDIKMVIAAGTLLAINVALTVVVNILASYGVDILGIDMTRFQQYDGLYASAVAFLSIWFMFVLIYRYLPARRIQWRIAVIAATFTGVFFELTKAAFTWYVGSVANYSSAYGNFATIIVLFLWVYYMAVIFIIGGEVGQVAALRKIRQRQKERLS